LLLGRDGELERLDQLMARVGSSSGAVAMVEGPAGIGKTALLAEAARRGSSYSFSVLRAAGVELEREYAFGVLRQLFAPVVAPGRESTGLLEGAAALAAVPLGLVAATAEAATGTGDAAAAAMHGLYWLTANLAEQAPLVLVLDDAHWADAMSLRFVLYLARRLADLPVLVLVAARSAARQYEGELLAQLATLPALVVLRPAPLTAPEVARLVLESGLRDAQESFIAACHRASGGNPFLLGELLAEQGAKGSRGSAGDAARVADFAPTGVVRWVLARLVALGEDAERLAFAFAVLGASAGLSDAAAVAGLELCSVTAAADALIGAHILTAERPYEFVHPLVRAAVYDGLSPVRRADAHARAARLTAERGAPLARVAAHLLASDPGSDGWVVDVLRAAAREADASGAPGSTASYLERAIQETQRPAARAELLLELGEAQLHAGLAGATQRMREALDMHADPRRRAEICLTLGRALFSTGDYASAREARRRGLGELPDEDDDLVLELHGWYITIAGDDPGLPVVAEARLRALLEDDALGRTPTERVLLAQLAYAMGRSGKQPCEKVARLARRALANGALLEDSAGDMAPYGAACETLLFVDPRAAVAELSRAIELSQRRGWQGAFGWFSFLRGAAHQSCGELIEAIADLERASDTYTPDACGVLALCLIERDDLAGAADALALPGDHQLRLAQDTCVSYVYALGRLKAAQGRLREGLDTLLECERLVGEINVPNPSARPQWRPVAALLSAELGERDRARELAAEHIRLASAFGAPEALAIGLRAAGLIEGGNRGLEQLAQAVVLLDGRGHNLELARTLTEQGAALRRAGHRRHAREPLRRGLDLATSCGALVLGKRAREELIATGARPRRERLRGADALTAGELRVARMAANGMTNRQIAQALFITIRTVTTHLGHAYQKLDITGREQLVAKLAEQTATALGVS
jgi:DNA-binding CsgD family transcriptional regulator